ncbi:hypothetical protein B0H63DRAFT_498314 [Podospora didyma]|uniref:ATPase AAA-type core domain-containing protein n=1 Tax=Podospora didyma TaxID=330526 RepID=A0AAE0P3I6_9PEZI|nr:hypothetical protein B0H63DRAFT_498314 [Podospora didyma]
MAPAIEEINVTYIGILIGSEATENHLTNGDTVEKKNESAPEETNTTYHGIPILNDGAEDHIMNGDSVEKNESVHDEDAKTEKSDHELRDKAPDRKYNHNHEPYFEERDSAEVETPKQKDDWWRLYSFCLVRFCPSNPNKSPTTSLYVNAQTIRQLLVDVIGKYPGNPIDVDDACIHAPYHPLFYYRRELEAEGLKRLERGEDGESLEQLNLLLGWIKSHFEAEIAALNKCIANELKAISYDNLWTLFPPNVIVHCKILDQHRAFRLKEGFYDTQDENPGFVTRVLFVDFDGESLGTRRLELSISKFTGTRELKDLSVVPLALREKTTEIRKELFDRGKQFESYIGQHYLQYNAIALKVEPNGYSRISVNGRVMIDCKTYHRCVADDAFTVTTNNPQNRRAARKGVPKTKFSDEKKEYKKLSDDDFLLTNATVRGFCFAEQAFLEFFVDDLYPIEWNSSCFDNLVLDPSTKKTIQALATTHAEVRDSFDDIVQGKGRGLVCVLHGPPGVGKTLTAECVAEYVKRPLYMVSSGIRIGILFLTTNRVATFDEAFKSHIHIPLRYTNLSLDSRTQIWRNFCKMVPGGVDIDEKGLAKLAELDLNGRQIKNAIKAAESLATFDKVKLDLDQLLQVTKIQAVFEKDLTRRSEIDYTALGGTKKDTDHGHMFL